MSFNRLNYDTCSYKQVLEESIGPGEYQLATLILPVNLASTKIQDFVFNRMVFH